MRSSMTPPENMAYPVLALLLGATMWGVVWYPMRLLEGAGLSGLWQSLLIYSGALIASLPRTAVVFRETTRHPGVLLPIMVFAGWTNIAFVLAVLDGNILRVLLLFYLSPVWATVLGRWILKERLSRPALLTLAVAMVGAVLMLWDTRQGFPWPQGHADWLAITSGMAFAANNLFVRMGQDIGLGAKLGATWLGVVSMAVLLLLFNPSAAPVFTVINVGGAFATGILGVLVMTSLVQYGVTHMPVHRSAVILLFELVAGAVSQQLLTDETMTRTEWLGGGLIIAAAWLSSRSSLSRRRRNGNTNQGNRRSL